MCVLFRCTVYIYIDRYPNDDNSSHHFLLGFIHRCQGTEERVKPSSLRVRPAMHKRRLPVELELTWGFAVFYLGKVTNVGKTIINHPPVITIFIGGIFSIPSHGW